MRGRSDGRVQRLLKKSLGSVTFRQHFAHFSLRWHEADFVGERAYGDLPFQEDENCYKDSGKPLRPRMWRTGRPVLHRRLVVDVVAGGVQGFCAPGPPGDGRWLEMGPKSFASPSPSPRASSEPFLPLPLSLLWKDSILPSQGREPLKCPERHWDSEDRYVPAMLCAPGLSPGSLSRFAGIFPNFLVSFITSLPAVVGEGLGWMNWRSGG